MEVLSEKENQVSRFGSKKMNAVQKPSTIILGRGRKRKVQELMSYRKRDDRESLIKGTKTPIQNDKLSKKPNSSYGIIIAEHNNSVNICFSSDPKEIEAELQFSEVSSTPKSNKTVKKTEIRAAKDSYREPRRPLSKKMEVENDTSNSDDDELPLYSSLRRSKPSKSRRRRAKDRQVSNDELTSMKTVLNYENNDSDSDDELVILKRIRVKDCGASNEKPTTKKNKGVSKKKDSKENAVNVSNGNKFIKNDIFFKERDDEEDVEYTNKDDVKEDDDGGGENESDEFVQPEKTKHIQDDEDEYLLHFKADSQNDAPAMLSPDERLNAIEKTLKEQKEAYNHDKQYFKSRLDDVVNTVKTSNLEIGQVFKVLESIHDRVSSNYTKDELHEIFSGLRGDLATVNSRLNLIVAHQKEIMLEPEKKKPSANQLGLKTLADAAGSLGGLLHPQK